MMQSLSYLVAASCSTRSFTTLNTMIVVTASLDALLHKPNPEVHHRHVYVGDAFLHDHLCLPPDDLLHGAEVNIAAAFATTTRFFTTRSFTMPRCMDLVVASLSV